MSNDNNDTIIIDAQLITQTDNAWYLNCEGDYEWFPKSTCTFDAEKEELEVPKWLLRNKFPNEKY